jgi:hypothetical protein
MKFGFLILSLTLSASAWAAGSQRPQEHGEIQCLAKYRFDRPGRSSPPTYGHPELNESDARRSALDRCERGPRGFNSCVIESCWTL